MLTGPVFVYPKYATTISFAPVPVMATQSSAGVTGSGACARAAGAASVTPPSAPSAQQAATPASAARPFLMFMSSPRPCRGDALC